MDGAACGSAFQGVGTSGSDCKAEGEVTLSELEGAGKLQDSPCPFCAIRVTMCELSASSTFHPELHSWPHTPILRSLYHKAPVTWQRLHGGTRESHRKTRDREMRAEFRNCQCCTFPEPRVCLWYLILLDDTSV